MRAGFIIRYQVGALKLIQVSNFKKHQSPHHTEKASILPSPTKESELTVTSPLIHGEPTKELPVSNGKNPSDSLIHRFSDSPKPDSLKQTSSSEQENSSDQVTPTISHADNTEALTSSQAPNPSREAESLAELLRAEILRNKPDYRITKAQCRKWAVAAQRMMDIDKRKWEDISVLIEWVQRDGFWKTNVLSMDKLREKFDQLQMKRGQTCPKPTGRHSSFADVDYTKGTEGFVVAGGAQ